MLDSEELASRLRMKRELDEMSAASANAMAFKVLHERFLSPVDPRGSGVLKTKSTNDFKECRFQGGLEDILLLSGLGY